MGVSPYPYGRWQRLSRAEANMLNGLSRALPTTFISLEQAAARLLDTSLSVRPAQLQLCSQEHVTASLDSAPCAGLFSLRADAEARLAVELEPQLAGALVDRMLGGEGDGADHAVVALEELELGVLAYLAARIAGAVGGVALHVHAAHAAPLLRWLGAGPLALWRLQVQLAGQRFEARVWLGQRACSALAQQSPAPQRPAWLSALPLQVDAVAARASLPRSVVRTLAIGDVILPEHCALARSAGGWQGRAELAVRGSTHAAYVCQAAANRLTIEAPTASSATRSLPTRGTAMKESDAPNPTADPTAALGDDAPVTLELCLARFRMSLGELSALSPGQVLDTGQPIGQRVTLRVAEREVAEGELVEVDGDVGVRVLRVL